MKNDTLAKGYVNHLLKKTKIRVLHSQTPTYLFQTMKDLKFFEHHQIWLIGNNFELRNYSCTFKTKKQLKFSVRLNMCTSLINSRSLTINVFRFVQPYFCSLNHYLFYNDTLKILKYCTLSIRGT